MAAKKRETQNTEKNQMLVVDARKLSQGLKTTFEGVAMVFDSIGVEADITVPVAEGKPSVQAMKETGDGAEVKAAEGKGSAATTEEKSEAQAVTAVPVEKAEATTEKTPAEEPAPSVPSVTIDDITKIIVQKIKKNRSNNEKIGAILKTYGVSKVGELPTDKYEAFLTDLSAI